MAATWDEFERLQLTVGTIVDVEAFPEARVPAYKLTIDFGPLGLKRSSAQLAALYTKEELQGRLVVAVVNFPPRRIGTFVSEVLTLGVDDGEGRVALLTVERDVPLGGRVY